MYTFLNIFIQTGPFKYSTIFKSDLLTVLSKTVINVNIPDCIRDWFYIKEPCLMFSLICFTFKLKGKVRANFAHSKSKCVLLSCAN